MERLGMRVAVLLVASLLTALGSTLAHSELARVNMVDRIRVDKDTRQATLVLVADLALDRDDAAQMLERKVGFYLQYVEGGRLRIDRTGISRDVPVVISFNLMVPPSQQVRDYLAGIKQALEKRGYEIRFNVFDASTKKMLRE